MDIDFDAILMAGLKGDAKTLGVWVPRLLSEIRRLREVEVKYDQFLHDAMDVTAAVMREFPGSTHISSTER
jgi:hypothetical protein